MGIAIFIAGGGVVHKLTCDRCRVSTLSDVPGGDYIAFRRAASKAGWLRRRGQWFGPCCADQQLSLDLGRTEKARSLSHGQ